MTARYIVTDLVAGQAYHPSTLREVIDTVDYILPDAVLETDAEMGEKDALIYSLFLWNFSEPLESSLLGLRIARL